MLNFWSDWEKTNWYEWRTTVHSLDLSIYTLLFQERRDEELSKPVMFSVHY